MEVKIKVRQPQSGADKTADSTFPSLAGLMDGRHNLTLPIIFADSKGCRVAGPGRENQQKRRTELVLPLAVLKWSLIKETAGRFAGPIG